MIIKQIKWISEEAKEAEVIVSDGMYELICFCQPCNYIIGDHINDCLYSFEAKNIIRSEHQDYAIQKNNEIWGYKFVAQVVNANLKHVRIGNIIIELYNLPMDIFENEFVEFYCSRIDLY